MTRGIPAMEEMVHHHHHQQEKEEENMEKKKEMMIVGLEHSCWFITRLQFSPFLSFFLRNLFGPSPPIFLLFLVAVFSLFGSIQLCPWLLMPQVSILEGSVGACGCLLSSSSSPACLWFFKLKFALNWMAHCNLANLCLEVYNLLQNF